MTISKLFPTGCRLIASRRPLERLRVAETPYDERIAHLRADPLLFVMTRTNPRVGEVLHGSYPRVGEVLHGSYPRVGEVPHGS